MTLGKKRILFVLPSLCSGGAEKSLVTLLREMDREKYEIELFLFRREGLFLPLVPKDVRVSDGGEVYRLFDASIGAGVRGLLRMGKPLLALRRVLYGVSLRLPRALQMRLSWPLLRGALPQKGGYDAAVGYLEDTATYYTVDCVQAKRKISFLHTDYDRIRDRAALDAKYYRRVDCLAGVSALCTRRAEETFPFLRGRTVTIENLLSADMIREMAALPPSRPIEGAPIILTVGRMAPPKGIDLAVEACANLVQRGFNDLRWYHIGAGELGAQIRAQIASLDMQNHFILLGEQSNPYAFISRCDVYVQPSRFEGKSIAIDEAKCLCKPIVTTDFGTVRDQIHDGIDGIVTQMTGIAIADAVQTLVENPAKARALSDALRAEHAGNPEEIKKLYAILDS